ncbi:MAG: TRAP transporter small permease [Syntrophorhabdaceae bacterium]
MKYLDTINTFLNKITFFLGGIAVLALMVLATGNVVLRIFHLPFRGTYEIVSFLGAVVIAFALGTTQKRRDHIVVDILTDKYPDIVKETVDKVAFLAMTMFFSIVAWQLYVWGMKIMESSEVSETLKVIFHPYVFMVAIGFILLAFTTFVQFLKTLFHEEV